MRDLNASIILLTETVKQTLPNRSPPTRLPPARSPPILPPLAHPEDDPPPRRHNDNLGVESSTTGEMQRNYRLAGVKLPEFHGEPDDNIMLWIHDIENAFFAAGTPKDMKVPSIVPLILDTAKTTYHYTFVRNGNQTPSWELLKAELMRRYNNTKARRDRLVNRMKSVRYHGYRYMDDYIKQFQRYESQVYDMSFADRLGSFVNPLQKELAVHLKRLKLTEPAMGVLLVSQLVVITSCTFARSSVLVSSSGLGSSSAMNRRNCS